MYLDHFWNGLDPSPMASSSSRTWRPEEPTKAWAVQCGAGRWRLQWQLCRKSTPKVWKIGLAGSRWFQMVPDGSRWFQIELELLNWRATLMVWSCSFNTKYCNPDLSFLFHYIILHPNYLIDRSEYSGNILGVWICELPTANIPSLAVAMTINVGL